MAGHLSAAQQSELDALDGRAADPNGTSQLMQDIRAFGRLPKEVRGSSEVQVQERNLAERLRKARVAGHLSAAQQSELDALGERAAHLHGTSHLHEICSL